MPTLLVVGHGSRLAQANQDFEAFVRDFKNYLPGREIRWGYIELAEPLLDQAFEEAASVSEAVTVLPLFLFAAGHVKRDIPEAVQRAVEKYPHVNYQIAHPLGVDARMVELLLRRLEDSLQHLNTSGDETVVIVVGRGSSDADANSDFYKLVRILEEKSHFSWLLPCFVGITYPRLRQTLERAVRENPKAILIQPYLLFPGCLVNEIQKEVDAFSKGHPQISMRVGLPLGEDSLIFEALRERVFEAERRENALIHSQKS